jgi:uncharacterized protein YxeA
MQPQLTDCIIIDVKRGGDNSMKKQVLIIVSVALASFLMGTTFSVIASDGENPFVKIWQAIYNLQGRVENVEESMNEESYDSGWIDITDKCGQYFNITHNLNSTDVMVDIQGRSESKSIGVLNIEGIKTHQ